MENWSCCVCILVIAEVLRADPCSDYIETNDTTMSTTYEPTDVADMHCHSFKFKWYRFTGTDDGLLTRVCPEGLQCGSHSQIWINDSFPTVAEGERPTRVCIHTETSCCSSRNTIRMKNCSDFMVYLLVPTPPCVNYCFYARPAADQVKTKSKWIVPVAVGVSGVVLEIVIGIIIVYKVKYKSRIESTTVEGNYGSQKTDIVRNKKFSRLGDTND